MQIIVPCQEVISKSNQFEGNHQQVMSKLNQLEGDFKKKEKRKPRNEEIMHSKYYFIQEPIAPNDY
jgi:hypothetical protein